MIKVISGVSAGACSMSCSTDRLITRSRDLGQVQKEWNVFSDGAFRCKKTGQNKGFDDSSDPATERRQSFWSDHSGWSYPGLDDLGLTGWKQIDGKWCSFRMDGIRLPGDSSEDFPDQENEDKSDTSEVLNETSAAKSAGDMNLDIAVQRQEEINAPDETEDTDITNQGSVSENTDNHVNYAERGGNSAEAIESRRFSHEYDNDYHKIKEQTYTNKL